VEFVFVMLIAAAIAFEPIIHTHPLSQTSQSSCAVCVSVVGPATPLAQAPSAPHVVVSIVAAPCVIAIVQPAAVPLASRAPPEV